MEKYRMETLKAINESYDYEHRVTQKDVDTVNQLVVLIEQSRSKTIPQVGDMVEFTDKYGEYYSHTHIETEEGEELYICERPFTPFVGHKKDLSAFYTSTSGGAWTNIPKNLKYVGKKEKAFVVWGHNGACGNGAVNFFAEVSVWEYSEGNHEYTTKTHDRFHVSFLEDGDEYGYKYIVTKGGTSYTAFRTEKEYKAWLKTYHGVEINGYGQNSKMVWTFKQEEICLPLDKYLNIENAVIDSELCNGTIQECKRIYQGTTVITFLPYQNDRIELQDVKQYVRAYEA
ncbi:DUF4121 family protein (plasmid) [Aneurinibacillus sp. Ricciae_BoGa-3]|uniref:DUF4121 family protein n=1 Tax=Aneurinibacillus sp. Ricciae_BoGa-3 TaxID=3022697 RepID=UPI00233F951B|nr:DUF4121 family protein [Aneurinibacillus sp. Ricciae_BoGa-3]WCK57363.1 DUF4121 family protein [Aneurinibacillus sp. Ricciae_BoGa-3]